VGLLVKEAKTMSDLLPGDNLVDDLAEDFARRLREGERPSVEDYVARHPEWERDIRDVFSAVALVEGLKPQPEDARPAIPEVPIPQRLGDYRIVRMIGRGGMGIVYEAEQEALGRRVALKVLSAHLLSDERLRQRFRREAQAAARLHHTNIVPVFGVGEQDGLCFYVMQLIAGQGLDRALRSPRPRPDEGGTEVWAGTPDPSTGERTAPPLTMSAESGPAPTDLNLAPAPLDPRGPGYVQAVARVGLQVAEALDYAHAQGVLHRDIKPSNLLLDGRGTVWVTDFGVAKLAEGGNLTQSGDVVGTLRYMPPERFRGESDARGDVYSLGITLYELLTLRPAFPDTTPQHLIQIITHEDLPGLRKVRPETPSDLETIVLKATARDPVHRYQSAAALAEDLRRFLEDRPITARRTTALAYLWRWCRRNRLAASLAGTALGLLVLVAVVSSAAYVRTARANKEVEQANTELKRVLEAEQRQREHAEGTSALALKALNRIYERFAPNRIVVTPEVTVEGSEEGVEVPVQPVLSKEAAPLLEELLVFYERLAEQGSEYPRLRSQAAEANHRIGDIHQRLGHFEQAAAAYQRAIRLRETTRDGPGDATARVKLARSHNELGRVHAASQQPEEARRDHATALAILTGSPPDLARRPEYRYELARTNYFQARRPGYRGESRPGRPPGGGRGRGGPGRPPGPGRGDSFRRPGSERSPIQNAIRLLEELVAESDPGPPEYRHLLALCFRDAGPERFSRNPRSPSISNDRAVEILRKLVEDYPEVPDYRYDLSETYAQVDLFRFSANPDSVASARKRLQEALKLSNKLVADYPSAPQYGALCAQIHYKLGNLLARTHEFAEAEKELRRAVTLQTTLLKRYPEATINGFWLAVFQKSLASLLIGQKRWTEARPLLEEVIRRQTEVVSKDRRAGFAWGLLAGDYRSLSLVLSQMGEKSLADTASKKAEQIRKEHPGGPPGFRDRRRERR
jgi:eukaryotic-like serine/threonine-protein kinase